MTIPGFRTVPKTGVIFVTSEAARQGFASGDPALLLASQRPHLRSTPINEGTECH
jgi:hypothetical protein